MTTVPPPPSSMGAKTNNTANDPAQWLDLCGDAPAFVAWLQAHRPKQLAAIQASLHNAAQQCAHGHREHWSAALAQLAVQPMPNQLSLHHERVTLTQGSSATDTLPETACLAIREALMTLKPWRKGPWQYHDIVIDTEWRSDLKWQRIADQLNLTGKTVLDVGCGSGYHLFRMWQAGAQAVVGIDPTWLFVHQFAVFKRCVPTLPIWLLPLGMEQFPLTQAFDTVFSMGVLYHRRDPIGHLQQLKNTLASGGELILETLVVEGDSQTLLMPGERYAAMPNVWFIPSVAMLTVWLEKLKFSEITVLDITPTTPAEQRQTEWSGGASLVDFLDADNSALTREGYPAPLRATLRAMRA